MSIVRSAGAAGGSLASSTTSALLVATNVFRNGLIVENSDANTLYLKYGTTASATDRTVSIPAGGYWEMPGPVIYGGSIYAIWSADGAGFAYYTEL